MEFVIEFCLKFETSGMLRRISIAMSSNQAFKVDNGSVEKQIKPTSSFFGSPRFFTGFSVKNSSETESVMSPTSILDSKSYTAFVNPFWSDKNGNTSITSTCVETKHHPFEKKLDSKGVGLAIVDEEANKKNLLKPESRMVVFGSQLKIQIPSLPSSSLLSPWESPKSPADFGIKTRSSRPFSPCSSTQLVLRSLSASEMELSEDYTCVISRGPNPKTTHIFGDCIVENCCGVVALSGSKKESCLSGDCSHYSSQSFLGLCYNCKKKIGQGQDIYMNRGEKSFCSHECRFQEMMFDKGMEKSDLEDCFRTSSGHNNMCPQLQFDEGNM